MMIALGEVYTGVFSVTPYCLVTNLVKCANLVVQTSDSLWEELRVAGEAEYDRFWRLPIDDEYGPQIYSSNADLCNVILCPLQFSTP